MNKLNPFKWFVLQNFPFIEADFDALTNYELMCKVVEYLNATITKTNELGEQVETLTNWFNNLDLQDEVDKKLDEMAESGELVELISAYLNTKAILGFDTKASMKSAENLAEGSICRILGVSNYATGDGSYYRIRTLTSGDVIDEDNIVALTNFPTLIAVKIPNKAVEDVASDVQQIESEIEELDDKTTIFVGDSYGAGVSHGTIINGWPVYTKQALGLSNNEYYNFSESGSGFMKKGHSNHTLLELLQANISSVTDTSKVKRVVVCEGGNDARVMQQNSYTTTAELDTAIASFITYVNTNLPNAKIYIGFNSNLNVYYTAGGTDFASKKLFPLVIQAMKNAMSLGAVYLTGLEYALKDYSLYTDGDTSHPIQKGYEILGYATAQAMLTGSVYTMGNVHNDTFTWDDGIDTQSNLTINTMQIDDMINIGLTATDIIFDTAITWGGSSSTSKILTLGKVDSKYCKPLYNNIVVIPIDGWYRDSSGTYAGTFEIRLDTDGNITINTPIIKSGESTFHTPTNVTRLSFNNASIRVPAILC